MNTCILQEEENQDKDAYDPLRWILLALVIFICDSAGTINFQAFATNLQSRVWSVHQTLYLLSTERSFKKSVVDSRPVIHLTVYYPSAVDKREKFQTFSEFSGIKKELDPVWDESLNTPSENWVGGKCSVLLPLQADTSAGTEEVRLPGCQHLGWWQYHSPGSGKFPAS